MENKALVMVTFIVLFIYVYFYDVTCRAKKSYIQAQGSRIIISSSWLWP